MRAVVGLCRKDPAIEICAHCPNRKRRGNLRLAKGEKVGEAQRILCIRQVPKDNTRGRPMGRNRMAGRARGEARKPERWELSGEFPIRTMSTLRLACSNTAKGGKSGTGAEICWRREETEESKPGKFLARKDRKAKSQTCVAPCSCRIQWSTAPVEGKSMKQAGLSVGLPQTAPVCSIAETKPRKAPAIC